MVSAPVDVMKRTIQHLAQSKWQSSGLTDKAAKRLRLRGLSAGAVRRLSPRFYEAGALLIPYFDLSGRPTKFFRVRYLERFPGIEGQLAKPQKYDQLPVMQEVYYPPLMKQSWRQIADDHNIGVAITEGELKAACATYTQVIPCMALGGVYSFMSGKRGLDLLPSLREFVWKDRIVYVVYDNDLSQNPDVMRAQRLLAERLTGEGARVYFGAIPPGPAKGVDDLIVAHGKEAFQAVLDRASPFGEGSALWHLNEEVVLIRPPSTMVVERATGITMKPEIFTKTAYANRFYMAQEEVGKGKNRHVVLVKKPLAPRWIEWEHRAELARLTYEPGKPKVYDGMWNAWNGWGVQPKRGSVDQWRWLMDFLFARDHKARKYFEQWCAYPIQNPGAKLFTACVLWSRVKRVGKSMAALALHKIYGDNSSIVNNKQLRSEFNVWAKNRQLVIGEEIATGEKRIDADYLKFLITNPSFPIRDMYTPPYDIPNHTNFLFLSNWPDAVFLEDGDKRYMIHSVARSESERDAVRSKYEWCDKWLHGDGPAHLMDYLLRVNLKDFNPRAHAPDTTSKFQMIVASKTDVGLWVLRLQEDPTSTLRPLGERAAAECDLFTIDQLYRAFDPEGKWAGRGILASLGKHLASASWVGRPNGGQPLQCGDGKIHRLVAVRNAVKWEQSTRTELREHYDSFFNAATAGGVK